MSVGRSRFLTLIVAASGFAQLIGDPERDARTVLQAGLTGDVDTRRELAIALSLISTRDASAALLDSLAKDGDHLVREAAIDSLGEVGDRSKIGLVRAALDDKVPEVVFAAARALYRLDPVQSRSVLVSVFEKETDAKSSFLSAQLRSIIRSMKTPRSALMFAGRVGAGFLPVPGLGTGISAMNSMLLDAEFSPRAYALTLLASDRMKNQDTTKLLTRALKDEDWSVRAAGVQAIVTRGLSSFRKELIPLYSDRERKVRFRAAAAYLRLQYLAQPKR